MTVEERLDALEEWRGQHLETASAKFLLIRDRLEEHDTALVGLTNSVDGLLTAGYNLKERQDKIYKVVKGLVLVERGHDVHCTICQPGDRRPGRPYNSCKYKDLIMKISGELGEIQDE